MKINKKRPGWPILKKTVNNDATSIDAVNQGNWSLSIKLILKCFVIVK